MNNKKPRAIGAILPLLIICFCISGCSKLSGTYEAMPNSGSAFEKLIFSGDKVAIVTFAGSFETTYKKSGQQVTLNANGRTMTLTIDSHGDLDGGMMVGRFHKQ
jgi:hypothetical protein